MPSHHPDPALLLDFAAGASPAAVALAIACHLETCPVCRGHAAAFEAAGGVLLDALPGVPLAAGALDAALAVPAREFSPAIRRQRGSAAPRPRRLVARGQGADPGGLPRALEPYLPAPFADLSWRRFGAVETVRLSTGPGGPRAHLVRVAPGRAIQRHTHGGTEYVAVLSGGFADRGAVYDAGDFCVADRADDHAPVAEPDAPCVALVVHDAPMRFTGPLLRLLNPLIG